MAGREGRKTGSCAGCAGSVLLVSWFLGFLVSPKHGAGDAGF